MKILFAASEAAPYIKTGGLGDVASALPKALSADPDSQIYVFLPYYKSIKLNPNWHMEFITSFYVPLGWRNQYCGIIHAVGEGNLHYYFIDNEYYFCRDTAYGYNDDGERFAFFSKAVLESLLHLNWYPDVIHANDWQTALIPVFLKAFYQVLDAFRPIKTLFSIHNMEYQGKESYYFIQDCLGLPYDWHGTMQFDGCTNLMKAAINVADHVNTVSRTYATEIQTPYFSHGLHDVLRHHNYKLSGVVNGIDTEVFDPATDPLIPNHFDAANLSGKRKNKDDLQLKLGLERRDDVPMIIIISRLVGHKGVDLVQAVMEDLMYEDFQLVVIGTGDRRYEDMFRAYASRAPQRVSANIVFDNSLAHQAYAAADLVLMPSKQEPCGLTQLIAMRYGTVPIVRETGGLFDTVPAYNPETGEGLGFTFNTYNAHDMLDAIRRALALYRNPEQWNHLRRNVMANDSSWDRSVKEYWNIYRSL